MILVEWYACRNVSMLHVCYLLEYYINLIRIEDIILVLSTWLHWQIHLSFLANSKGRNGHVPFRDSKLTRILQPSLGGNARTAIICTISPARSHFEQSRNTLLFASCAKEVVNSAQVNVVMSDKALVKHLQKELARLESELRYPGISPSVEALLKEKDAQIKRVLNYFLCFCWML